MQESELKIVRKRRKLLAVVLVVFSLPLLGGLILLPFQSPVPLGVRILMTLFYGIILLFIANSLLICIKGYYIISRKIKGFEVFTYRGIFSKTKPLKGELGTDVIDYSNAHGSISLLVMIGFLSRYKLTLSEVNHKASIALWLNNEAQIKEVNSFISNPSR